MMRLQEELYSVRDALGKTFEYTYADIADYQNMIHIQEGDGIIRYPKRDASLESDETSRRSISSKDNEEAEVAQLSSKEKVLEGEEKQTDPLVNKADVMNDLMKDLIEMGDPTLSMNTPEIIDPIPVEQKELIQDLDNTTNINNTSH